MTIRTIEQKTTSIYPNRSASPVTVGNKPTCLTTTYQNISEQRIITSAEEGAFIQKIGQNLKDPVRNAPALAALLNDITQNISDKNTTHYEFHLGIYNHLRASLKNVFQTLISQTSAIERSLPLSDWEKNIILSGELDKISEGYTREDYQEALQVFEFFQQNNSNPENLAATLFLFLTTYLDYERTPGLDSPLQYLHNRTGDCFEHSVLAHAILTHCGLNPEVAYVYLANPRDEDSFHSFISIKNENKFIFFDQARFIKTTDWLQGMKYTAGSNNPDNALYRGNFDELFKSFPDYDLSTVFRGLDFFRYLDSSAQPPGVFRY